jgi:hypothetical protein
MRGERRHLLLRFTGAVLTAETKREEVKPDRKLTKVIKDHRHFKKLVTCYLNGQRVTTAATW